MLTAELASLVMLTCREAYLSALLFALRCHCFCNISFHRSHALEACCYLVHNFRGQVDTKASDGGHNPFRSVQPHLRGRHRIAPKVSRVTEVFGQTLASQFHRGTDTCGSMGYARGRAGTGRAV